MLVNDNAFDNAAYKNMQNRTTFSILGLVGGRVGDRTSIVQVFVHILHGTCRTGFLYHG